MKKSFFYGIHTAKIIVEKYPESINTLNISDTTSERIAEIYHLAQKFGLKVNKYKKAKLDELTGTTKHQGVALDCRTDLLFSKTSESDLKSYFESVSTKKPNHKFFILILDEVQDPQNLGACIRSAEAQGVDFVVVPERGSCDLTATVCKASAGAALLLPIFRVTNLARVITWLKEQGVWVYGSDIDTELNLPAIDFTGPSAVVMGAEGKGIRKLTRDLCDQVFSIPMYGQTQSLNVSVATGMCLYEVTRQRCVT